MSRWRSPLEDTVVALRPIIPPIPDEWNGLPNSIRLLDPPMPEGEMLQDTTAHEAAGLPIFAFSPDGEPIDVVNHFVNFGWEYVLHCHFLSHEEMDMMHDQVVGVKPSAPTGVNAVRTGNGRSTAYEVSWTDSSKNETGFVVERRVARSNDPWTVVGTVDSETLGTAQYTAGTGAATGDARTYSDPIGNTKTEYEYDVHAVNTVGDVWDYSDPAFNNIPPGGGFPTLTLDSKGGSTIAIVAPTDLTATAAAKNKRVANVTQLDRCLRQRDRVPGPACGERRVHAQRRQRHRGREPRDTHPERQPREDLLLPRAHLQRRAPVGVVRHGDGDHTVSCSR